MSKIFEALQQAGRDRDDVESSALALDEPIESFDSIESQSSLSPAVGATVQRLVEPVEPAPFPLYLEHTMTALYNSITSLVPTTKGRTIEFIAPHKGAGTSTLIREFAKVAAVKLKKTVLLLDADHHAPTQTREFQVNQEIGWDEVLERRDGNGMDSVLNKVEGSRLTVSQLLVQKSTHNVLFESVQFRNMLNRLKETFDLILIDAPPATEFADGLVLGSRVDGIVLVAAAEETRWQAMQDVTRRVQLIGGNVLGMILNNQRYHIPQPIYDRI